MSLFHTPSALMSANAPRLVLLSLTARSLLLALSPPPPSLSLSLPFAPFSLADRLHLSPSTYAICLYLASPFPPCLSSSLPLSFSPSVSLLGSRTAPPAPLRRADPLRNGAETRKPVSPRRGLISGRESTSCYDSGVEIAATQRSTNRTRPTVLIAVVHARVEEK